MRYGKRYIRENAFDAEGGGGEGGCDTEGGLGEDGSGEHGFDTEAGSGEHDCDWDAIAKWMVSIFDLIGIAELVLGHF